MTLTIDEKFALLQDMKVIDNNRQIVERLKKEIEAFKYIDSDYRHFEVEELLEKILGDKK